MATQLLLSVAGGLILLASTVRLVRRQYLSIRYGLGWMAVSVLAIVGAPLLVLFSSKVTALGFTPTGFSLGILGAFLGLVCLQLSISLSGVQRALQDLSESTGLLEQRLRELERERERE